MSVQKKELESILQETGIEFEDAEDYEMFCTILQDEMELRIGIEIEKNCPDELMISLDNVQTEEDKEDFFSQFDKWAAENPIMIQKITSNGIETIKKELKQYKNRILGLKKG